MTQTNRSRDFLPLPKDDPHLLHRYELLVELSSDIASTLDLDLLLNRIVEAAQELTGSEAASLLLHDPESGNLFFQAATNLLDEGLGSTAIPTRDSIAGWIFQHGEPLLVQDALQDQRFFGEVDAITRFKTQSILGVPLTAKGKTLGVIEVVNKCGGSFDELDTHLLQTLAAQAAVAIENIRLFHQNDLVAEMVHELRTPLTALTAAANLLQRPDLPDSQRTKLATTVFDEVQRLSEMTSDFLDFSRLQAGRIQFQREPVHLGGLLEEVLELVRPQAKEEAIRLQVNIDPKVAPVHGDRNLLKQVILNLLNNAIKYNRPDGNVSIRLMRDGDHALIEFEDCGRGIPEKDLPRIFERFYRVPAQANRTLGTGLGLTIVKRIIESHNGNISVESTVDKGSIFRVRLPAGSSTKRES